MKSYITNYYKDLFGKSEEGNFSIDESRTHDIPRFQMWKIVCLWHLILWMKSSKMFFKWNITRPLDLIVSELSSINVFGRSLNWTCLFYLPLSMSANSNCSA
jgi:hypothetical protein